MYMMSVSAFAEAFNKLWFKNFAKPQGILGELVGQYLAFENYELNIWAVNMLNIQPEETVLEVGFGPGIAIRHIVQNTEASYIAGFDYSELMVEKAQELNAKAIAQQRVQLFHADTDNIPSFEKHFTKILAINNVMYWNNPYHTTEELFDLLEPGGYMCLVLQRNEELISNGACREEFDCYRDYLEDAGFENVTGVGQVLTLKRKFQKDRSLVGILIYGQKPLMLGQASRDGEVEIEIVPLKAQRPWRTSSGRM